MIWYKLKHDDGKIHLNDYWIDDEFSIRYWDSKEEAEQFAKSVGTPLKVEEVNE